MAMNESFARPPSSPPGARSGPLAPAPAYPHQVPVAPAPAIPQPARRAPVTYQPNEGGWWLASDGLWYPPETSPGAMPPPGQPLVSNPSGHAQTVIVQVAQPHPQPHPQPWGPSSGLPITSGSPRSKAAACLLAIFLGALGVHRFYLGNSGLGVTMLLISVLSAGLLAPIVALWAFIEGIMILTGGIRDAQGRVLV